MEQFGPDCAEQCRGGAQRGQLHERRRLRGRRPDHHKKQLDRPRHAAGRDVGAGASNRETKGACLAPGLNSVACGARGDCVAVGEVGSKSPPLVLAGSGTSWDGPLKPAPGR